MTTPRTATVDGRLAVTVPARILTPTLDVHVDGAWRHLYSASTSTHYLTTQVIWTGPGPYTERLRRTEAHHRYVVAVPDISGLPPETPELAALDRFLSNPRVWHGGPGLSWAERDVAARWLAAELPADEQEAMLRHYKGMPTTDLAANYHSHRRWTAARRGIVALAE
ncbi:hypothetical protein ABT095_15145 [Kitasatospora sp. NPDC002227]|uniref:hypothetical protein n=1 Tax=Kitasatospora sp. NPDC002227 TaxID=3154773 RepID=UPI00331AA94B